MTTWLFDCIWHKEQLCEKIVFWLHLISRANLYKNTCLNTFNCYPEQNPAKLHIWTHLIFWANLSKTSCLNTLFCYSEQTGTKSNICSLLLTLWKGAMMTVWKYLQNFSSNIMFTIPPNIKKNTMLFLLLLTKENSRQMWHLRALPWVENVWQMWSLLFSKVKLHICYMWKSVFSSSWKQLYCIHTWEKTRYLSLKTGNLQSRK